MVVVEVDGVGLSLGKRLIFCFWEGVGDGQELFLVLV